MSSFKSISARQIFDSRGYPTIESKVVLDCGSYGIASVPAGASKGSREVLELRDGEKALAGKSVNNAVAIVNSTISKRLKIIDPFDQMAVDETLKTLDGSENLSNIGGNTILSISLAVAKAAANSKQQELFRYLAGDQKDFTLPVPFINLINGGMHACNSLGIQEFMIVPVNFTKFSDALHASFEIFYVLKKNLASFGVGDEGGFAPDFKYSKEALDSLMQAIEQAGFVPGKDIYLALDMAASELCLDGLYRLDSERLACTYEQWAEYIKDLVDNYPICSVEDGMAENDLDGWQCLTNLLGKQIQLVGDDVFVTQSKRLLWGIENNIANSVLIKPNQVGTLTDTLLTWVVAKEHKYKTMISHRSGDTVDTFIADLAVSLGSCQIKTGGLCRSERIEKYNRLLGIEAILNKNAFYAGKEILFSVE